MSLRTPALAACLLLGGCAAESRVATLPVPAAEPAPVPEPVVSSDPRDCRNSIDCTLKTARTLLFVFDYAALGGPLLEREGRLLSSPPAPGSDWPGVRILLPAEQEQRFAFSSECQSAQCRYSGEELSQIYVRYLDGEACVLPGDPRRNCDL